MTPARKTFAWIFRRCESLLFLLVIPGAWMRWRDAAAQGDVRREHDVARRRWRRFLAHGFSDIRREWWTNLRLEPWRVLWRHVRLLEMAEVPSPALVPDGVRRILVVHLGHFGDLLHLMPMLKSLRRQAAGVRIELIVGPWNAEVAKECCTVDEVISYMPAMTMFQRGSRLEMRNLGEEKLFMDRLRGKAYEWVISGSFASNLPENFIVQAARPRHYAGPKPAMDLYSSPADTRVLERRAGELEMDRFMRLLPLAGFDADRAKIEYPANEAGEAQAAGLLNSLGIKPGQEFCVIAPGAGGSGKTWPAERFGELAGKLMEETKMPCLLAGSKDESPLCDEVVKTSGNRAISMAGRTSWNALAAILRKSSLFIGNDSGPLHLAAAVGTPTVSLFGPTEPARWAPRGEFHVSIRKVESCPDCVPWHVRATCAHGGECMRAISVDEVWDAVRGRVRAECS